jgi:hypothetical protein
MTVAAEHAELNEHLNAYLDGALDDVTRRRLERHLATCDVCPADLAQLRLTRDALRAMPVLRAPREFTLPVPLPSPGDRPSRAPSPAPVAPWLAWSWRLGSLGAAACLLLAVVTSLLAAPPTTPAVTVARAPFSASPTTLPERDTSARAPQGGAAQAPAAPSLAQRQGAQENAAASGAGGAPPGADQAQAPAGLAQAPPAAASAPPAPKSAPESPAAPGPPPSSLWLTVAFVLAACSAGLFALERRSRARAP